LKRLMYTLSLPEGYWFIDHLLFARVFSKKLLYYNINII
jgi:hypothetical protein